MRVTIFGGHGKIALLLTPMLVGAGHRVQSVVRNPDHAADVTAAGGEPVVDSLEESTPESLTRLLTGQDAVVWSAGAGGGNPTRTVAVDRDAAIRAIDAATAAGVRRFVTVSFSGAFPDDLVPEDEPFRVYQDAKIAADDHLRASGLDWTVLAPGTLTLDAGDGRVNPAASSGHGDTAARELVAQVALAVLDDPRSFGRTLVFGGGDVPVEEWLASLR